MNRTNRTEPNKPNRTNRTERLKSGQKCPVFGHYPKSELFGNGTIMKDAEIRTFEFQRSAVSDINK